MQLQANGKIQVNVIWVNRPSKYTSSYSHAFNSTAWNLFVSLTTVFFVRVVQAVVQSVTAQLFRDTDVVSTGPVRLQTAPGSRTVLLVWAGGTLDLSVTAGRRINTADRVHTRKLTRRTFRRAWERWREDNETPNVWWDENMKVLHFIFFSFYQDYLFRFYIILF